MEYSERSITVSDNNNIYRDRIVVTMKNAQEDYEVPYYCCGTILKDEIMY
jgi:hypothetical protein